MIFGGEGVIQQKEEQRLGGPGLQWEDVQMGRAGLATTILAVLDQCNQWQELKEFSDKALPQARGTDLQQKQAYWLAKARARLCR